MTETISQERLRGAAYLVVSQGVFVVSAYIINVVVLRRLGPVEAGVYGVVLTVLGAINIAQLQGVPQALSRAVAADPDDEGRLWRGASRIQTIGSLAAVVTCVALGFLLGVLLDDRRVTIGLLAAAISIPTYASFASFNGLLNGRHAFRTQGLLLTLYSLIRTVVIVGATIASGLYGAIVAFAVAPIVAMGMIWRGHRPHRSEAAAPWRELLAFSAASIGLALLLTALTSVDLLVVKGVVDDTAAGIYSAAQNIARVPYFMLLPAGQVLFPAMAELVAAGDDERLRRTVRRGVAGALTLLTPVVAILTGAARPTVDAVFGAKYLGAETAVELLVPAFGLLAVGATLAMVAAGVGRPRPAVAVAVVALVIQIGGGLLLAPDGGLRGAATATLVAAGVCLAGQALLVQRATGALVEPTRVARIVGAGLIPYLIATRAGSIVEVLLFGIVALAAYVALLFALRVAPELPRRGG